MRPVNSLRSAIFHLLISCILAGCIPLNLPKRSEPDEFKERSKLIDSLYGSNSDLVVNLVGPPAWVKKIGNTTYYIYVWNNTNHQMPLFLPAPVLVPHTRNWYCLLLEFNEHEELISHDVQTRTTSLTSNNVCLDVFSSLNAALAPSRLVKDAGIYCPNADLGHADAQYYIGNIYFDKPYYKPDLLRAYVWYSLAASGGHEVAATKLQKVLSELTPDQLSKASHLLKMWRPGECEKDLIEKSHGASR
jgi:hypothetical protein